MVLLVDIQDPDNGMLLLFRTGKKCLLGLFNLSLRSADLYLHLAVFRVVAIAGWWEVNLGPGVVADQVDGLAGRPDDVRQDLTRDADCRGIAVLLLVLQQIGN